MKNTKVIVIAVVLVLALGGAWKLLSNRQVPTSIPQEQQKPGQVQQEVVGSQKVLAYTDQGYIPASITIKKGDTILWMNEGTKDMWPASAMHPTHTVYPGSGIQKCNTVEQPNIFDACSPIAPGSSWSFKFLEQGSWKFHDHLSPTKFGTINVE
ncbi:MAG: hypothetical protein Q7R48_03470 [bacterium]|nr:hypothetical protein [bacterium]